MSTGSISQRPSTIATLLAFTALLLIWPVNAENDPIVVKGSHFFYKTNGTQFFIRGVLYRDLGKFAVGLRNTIDVLATKAACARDVQHFQKLGINTIAITAVDPKVDHTGCMELLQAAGIYVFVLLPIPSSNNYDTTTLGKVSYFDESSLSYWYDIVDTFHQYYNIAGFVVYFSGDEGAPASLLPSFRANVRDIKAHIKTNKYREIPVGAVAGTSGALKVFDFMTCGSLDTAIDFYAVLCDLDLSLPDQAQSWMPMFDQFTKDYRNASIPIFLSYGHAANASSKFEEVPMIYRPPMADIFSGVIMAEWIPDDSGTSVDSGLVQIHANNMTLRPGYTAFAGQLASIQPSATKATEYVPTNTANPECHTMLFKDSVDYFTNTTHDIEISPVLPVTPSATLCSCMMNSLECYSSNDLHPVYDLQAMTSICQDDSPLCAGIRYNSTGGEYGAYNQCNVTAKSSWARNQYYLSKNKDPEACTSVNGTIQTAVVSDSQNSACNILLRQAKTDGTGTITSFPASATGLDTSRQRNGSPSNPMNTATKAGIITSVVVVGLLCLALAIYFAMRWRRSTKKSAKNNTSELPANSASWAGGNLQIEIEGTPKVEMAAEERWELAAQDTQVHELEAASETSRKNSTA